METKVIEMRWSVDQCGTWLSVLVDNPRTVREYADANFATPQRMTLKKWCARRSINANAYLWALLGKLSEVVKEPPEAIYKRLIPDVGNNAIISTIKAEHLPTLRKIWGANGKGWIVELLGCSDVSGCVDVMQYYGSSVYDREQMARLIDLVIQECRQQGVEHLPQNEIDSLLERWE